MAYDSVEDRVSIDGRSEAGDVLRLWLTRRLLLSVLGCLCSKLSVPASLLQHGINEHPDSSHVEPPQQPVTFPENGYSMLVCEVDLKCQSTGLRLCFRSNGDPDKNVILELDDKNVLKLTAALSRQALTACWRNPISEGIAPIAPQPSPADSTLH